MSIRLRIPELLEAAGLTAWGLHMASEGRVTASKAYRLVRRRGGLKSFDLATLEVLCDVLQVEPGELFEREPAKAPPKKRGAKAPAKASKKRL